MDGRLEYRLDHEGLTMDHYTILRNPDGLDAAAIARAIDPHCFGYMGDARHLAVFKD